VVKLGRTLGRVAWAIDIPSPKVEAYRDTRGPGLGGWKALLTEAPAKATTPQGKRDLALVRLMHDLELRRGEVVALDLADLYLEAGTVAIVGNGKSE
jgi:integrase/recombinase XerC